jgi:hypothetical protein
MTLLRHRWFSHSFWPVWFAEDKVNSSSDHLPYLHRNFEPVHLWPVRTSSAERTSPERSLSPDSIVV